MSTTQEGDGFKKSISLSLIYFLKKSMKKLTKYGVNYFHGKISQSNYHLFQKPGQPIHLRVSFLAGSRFDNIPGTAHFLEHLLLAGSQKYPNKRLLAETLENIGGSIGAFTTNDFLTIFLEFAEKKDWAFALSILDEVINQPLFEEQTIKTERGAILSEIQMRFHNRATRVIDISNTLIYQGTPCGKITIGDNKSVDNIKKSDLVNFYETIFKKNPVNWSVAGDVDEKELVKIIAKLYKPVSSFKQIITKEIPLVRKRTTYLENFEDNKADLCLSFRVPSAGSADIANLDIISSYLAKDRGCKLQDELRYKRGLVYSCRGDSYLSFDYGEWYLTTSCLANNAQKVIDIIIKEIKILKRQGIAQKDLCLIKNKLIKGNIIKLQTSKDWAESASHPGFVASPDKFLISTREKNIEKTTIESITQTAKKYFTKDNWFLVMCGPKSLSKIKMEMP